MDKNLKTEKLKMWKENLARLEKELASVIAEREQGEETSEDTETYQVQIEQVKKIIADLETK